MDPRHSWPQPILDRVGCAAVTDSSGWSGATTWRIETEPPQYLKIADAGTLKGDAEGLRWFQGGPIRTPEVLEYISSDRDYLLTAAVPGTVAYESPWRDDPARLASLLGKALRAFHDGYDLATCPLHYDPQDMLARVQSNYAAGNWEQSKLDWLGSIDPHEGYQRICEHIGRLKPDVILHGDWCLPNVLLQDWQVSGTLDLGMAGRGDRHYDLHWCIWSLDYNLHTRDWTDAFLDAYGRDALDPERLALCGLISAYDG